MKGIRNKTAFVTGAEKGLGREIAKVFAREGANVVIFGLDEENGLRTEKDTAALGVRSVFIQGSVTSSKDLERAFALAKEKFGRIDFAVNCAGVANAAKKLHEFSEEEYDKLLGVDLKGVFLSMKYELEDMLRYNDGMIVNIASNAGTFGCGGIALYSAAKHGVIGLTKSAALDYAKTGIRINALCPGTMSTPMIMALPQQDIDEYKRLIPVGDLIDSSYVAENAVWLCSDASRYTTGSAFLTDGGSAAQ